MIYTRFGKRTFDVVVSVLALPVVVVASVFVWAGVKLEDGGPLFYRAQRRGRRGVTFTMFKFRSMAVDAPDRRNPDGSTFAGVEDSRVTRVGRVLRKTSVDELPQFFNVLRGDMSLVGPRPNMAGRAWSELGPLERKRLLVRPGITGLTQARHRNSVSAREKDVWDCRYVDALSFSLDLRILFETATAVVSARNVHAVENVAEHGIYNAE